MYGWRAVARGLVSPLFNMNGRRIISLSMFHGVAVHQVASGPRGAWLDSESFPVSRHRGKLDQEAMRRMLLVTAISEQECNRLIKDLFKVSGAGGGGVWLNTTTGRT